MSGRNDEHTSGSAEEILAARRSQFVSFVEGRVHDRALAEDLVQGAFEHALARLGDVRDEASVVAWFYRSLRNAIVDRHRRYGTEARALEQLAREIDDRVEPEPLGPPRVCPCVLRIAESLKPEYADALRRIEVEDAAVHAFAEERGITSANAAARVFRARQALRRGVLATCGGCAASGCVDCTCSSESDAAGHTSSPVR